MGNAGSSMNLVTGQLRQLGWKCHCWKLPKDFRNVLAIFTTPNPAEGRTQSSGLLLLCRLSCLARV